MSSFTHMARQAVRRYRTATSSMRMMPDFIIIGVARGGTTSLYNYLIEHPDIGSAEEKEIHFFDNQFQKGFSWYRRHFPLSLRKYLVEGVRKRPFTTGEASPYYIFHPYAPARIAEALPHVKLLVLLRNPIERAYSHYAWEVSWGAEKLSFEEAIDWEEVRIKKDEDKLATQPVYYHQHSSYVTRGLYADQLETWFKLFPREQFLIVKSEDMYKDPAAIYKQTVEFLGVPCITPKSLAKEYKQYNRPKKEIDPAKKMSNETRQRLAEFYKPHNERLYKLLDRDFGWT